MPHGFTTPPATPPYFFLGFSQGLRALSKAWRGFETESISTVRAMRVAVPAISFGQYPGLVKLLFACGEVGKEFVRLLQPFDCTVLACDLKDYADLYAGQHVTPVGFDELLARFRGAVDSPHGDEPHARALRRGDARRAAHRWRAHQHGTHKIIDEAALRERSQSRRIAAAAIDAFAVEPPTDDELLRLPNFIGTPRHASVQAPRKPAGSWAPARSTGSSPTSCRSPGNTHSRTADWRTPRLLANMVA
jgi:hypothetical protein